MKFVLATKNKGKVSELRKILQKNVKISSAYRHFSPYITAPRSATRSQRGLLCRPTPPRLSLFT